MTAAAFVTVALAVLLYACVSTYRDAKRREAMDASPDPLTDRSHS